MLQEFGSDYHTLDFSFLTGCTSLSDTYPSATLLADGRQGIIALVQQEGWRRLWVPEYFCYDVLESVKRHTGTKMVSYRCCPGYADAESVRNLPFEEGDAILRMNFFGLYDRDIVESWPVPVVEDHSHDILSRWALSSKADWCLASLRKTLPIAEGGMVWSPKGYRFSVSGEVSAENAALAENRWYAMDLKANFLLRGEGNKELFRKLYTDTEEAFDSLEISSIDERSRSIVQKMDIKKWYDAKKKNWEILIKNLYDGIDFLKSEDESCTPFSLVLICDTEEQRERVRNNMISESVYPAVLWKVPGCCSPETRKMSRRLLSVHCDGRYTEEDMLVLAEKINSIFEKL